MISKKVNEIILYFSIFFLNIFVKLNLSFFTALILFINLRKVKKIYTRKVLKKIIILSKSGGLEDIISAYSQYEKYNKFGYYTMPRILIKKIFIEFLKNENYKDFVTIDFNENVKKKKIKYKIFLKKVFFNLNKFWCFDAVIGFNPFYYAEHDLAEPIKNIGKKFLVIHKESLNTEQGNIDDIKIYKNLNKKHFADKVAVYSEYEKKKLIDTNFLEPNQVEVTGCARSSNCFKIRNIKPLKNKVVYFMIVVEGPKSIKWSNLANSTIKYLIEYAYSHPLINIVFKGKRGVHSIKDLPNDLPPNCSFELLTDAQELLTKTKVVICFNSTILFEAIMANREIIIPSFKVNRTKFKKFIYKSPNFFANSKEFFFHMLDRKINKPYKLKKLSKKEKECVDYYLGNADGKASIRLKKFIEKNLQL